MTAAIKPLADFPYLVTPPESRGDAPLTTRPQRIPLGSLDPRDFERLCFRLTRLNSTVEQCRFYGTHGQAQEGIDLYARRHDGTYMVVQCKRRSDGFTPGEMTAAVDRFVAGEWARAASVLVLAVTANLDGTQAGERMETERNRLAKLGVKFLLWDETELSAVLKDHPVLVDDFFGREAVRVFIGPERAEELGDRLDVAQIIEYRRTLGELYREVFQRLERGIHSDDRSVPLDDRFVVPDVIVSSSTSATLVSPQSSSRAGDAAREQFPSLPPSKHLPYVVGNLKNPALEPMSVFDTTVHHGDRLAVTDWLNTGSQHVVVGAPGSGKSALLRMLVLDVLSPAPLIVGHVDRLQGLLPVWLPFAYWTNTARKSGRPVSVLDAARDWLNTYDHGHVWPLVERALRDDRLLLVVDGFDEWASPDLARACIDRLEVFASTKRTQVLASSRPFSAVEVPIETEHWRIGTLAPLDGVQQFEFIRKWLTPLVSESAADAEAADWSEEIARSHHLRELSHYPLFLLLLLRSREQQAEFPEDLHAVVDDAVTRLVGEHRRRKVDAAGSPDHFPSSGDIRKASGAVAEHMHVHSIPSITDDDLREVIRHTLVESIGYPDSDAHGMASALVNSLSPGVGVMVRPAPDETQFFHRSVLEFLTAEHLLARPRDQILGLFRERLGDRRWSQVLRFLVRGLVRPPEISAIFDVLDEADVSMPLLREATDLLAADVAVGVSHADAATRRRLLSRVIEEVETGEREAHRAELVEKLAAGLFRREIRANVETRLSSWLRGCPRETRLSALQAASAWEPDEVLLGILWHGLLDEADDSQRMAGRVLGTKFAEQEDVATHLEELASTTRLPGRRAAATEALSLGWPDHPGLDTLIETGREHLDFAVEHASVAADLRRGNRTVVNRSLVIDLLDHSQSLSAWAGGLLELMFEHYPDDDAIFEHYVKDADPEHAGFRFGDVPATFLVLRGYTARPEAKRYLLKLIGRERLPEFSRTPSLVTDRIPWHEIAEVYGRDDEVVAAVETQIGEHMESPIGDPHIYYCSLVARTDTVRDLVIRRIQRRESWGIGWPIRALVEGWPDDPKAQQTLADIVDPAIGRVPDGAIRHLTEILNEPSASLDKLANLAADTENQGVVVDTLNEILKQGVPRDDLRAASIIDRALDHDMTNPWTSPEASLYVGFGDDHRVRELAMSRLGQRDAPLASIVYGFRNDSEIRDLVADHLRPLSAPLRGRLVESLAQLPIEDTAVTALLSKYDSEPDPVVKILAITTYARRSLESGANIEGMLDTFTEQARALGSDLSERRAAAFCGLAELGRLDHITDLSDRVTPDEPVKIQYSVLGDRTIFFRYVCRHWNAVKAALGETFSSRFGFREGNDSEFWRDVLIVAHDYPATRADLIQRLDNDPALLHSAEAVSYLSRTEPRSNRLFNETLNILRGVETRSYHDIQPAWVALELLEEQFGDDARVRTWLTKELELIDKARIDFAAHRYLPLPAFGILAGAARHIPEHPLVTELVSDTSRREDEPWQYFQAWVELKAGVVPSAQEFADFAVEVADIIDLNDLFPDYLHRPLSARLRRDELLAASLAELVPNLSERAIGIAVRLLALSRRIDRELAEHLRSRLDVASRELTAPTIDPLTGKVRAIETLFLDVLDTIDGS